MSDLLSALSAINVSELTYTEWIAVGMALKEEGYPCSVWDDWSQNDNRYHPGECEKKWETFNGSGSPTTGGTIIKMAQERGWTPSPDIPLAWDDTIECDGTDGFTEFDVTAKWSPSQDLITYLETLFKPDDIVGYVTNDAWQNTDGKWVPSKGVYFHTAEEIISKLKKYGDDIGAAVGDWKPEAGAWIRFNPLDGNGVKNENVTAFRYALVESDSLSLEEQERVYRQYNLPIAAMVYSGGKSIHAIVHIDAENEIEYKARVNKLYQFLEDNGVTIDKQNRNPSRLSRMPGAVRNGKEQRLIGTNIGLSSWAEWERYLLVAGTDMPPFVEYKLSDSPRPVPEELIKGVLRRGHKMLLSGSSKAGKSFLLMELCVALVTGQPWLGFECKKSRVLYINLEIDPESCLDRFDRIFRRTRRIDNYESGRLVVWNLRGKALPLDKLSDILIERMKNQKFDAVVLDPIYKVITGDENNATEMGAFCNQFDKICTETGCSAIYCHHHSKGAQGMKKAMDRASGSGVFARDPDAQLDIIELELSDHIKNFVREGHETGWRLESSLREFENFKPVNFWFDYPIHVLDTTGELEKSPTQGSAAAGRLKNSYKKSSEEAAESFRDAYTMLSGINTPVTVKDMEGYLGVSDKTIYGRLKKLSKEFRLEKGCIYPIEDDDQTGKADSVSEQGEDLDTDE